VSVLAQRKVENRKSGKRYGDFMVWKKTLGELWMKSELYRAFSFNQDIPIHTLTFQNILFPVNLVAKR
jgi:hypothetical protein